MSATTRGAWLLAATLAALIPAAGCGRVLGVDDYRTGRPGGGPDSGPGGAGAGTNLGDAGLDTPIDASPDSQSPYFSAATGVSFAWPECGACADQNCVAGASDCLGDFDCIAWIACRAACRDEECIAACPRRVPRAGGVLWAGTASPSAWALAACLSQHCETPCVARYGRMDVPMSPTCYQCASRRCTDALTAPIEDDQRTVAMATCVGLGGRCSDECVGSDFSCVGSVKWPTPRSLTFPAEFKVYGVDVQLTPITASGQVKACRASDDCESPLATATFADGMAVFTLNGPTSPINFSQAGFLDFWEFTASDYVTSLNWAIPPPVRSGFLSGGGVTKSTFDGVVKALGGTVDFEKRGAIWVVQMDCSGAQAPGVTLEVIDSSTADTAPRISYLNGTLPDPALSQTGSSGYALAVDVTAGAVTVKTHLVSADHALVSSQTVIVRPGAVTVLPSLFPTPSPTP